MKDYHINVFYSDDDRCYVADIPDLRFCSAFGATPEKAVREVQIAKRAWLKVAKDEGRLVPKPTYRPAIYQAGALKSRTGPKDNSLNYSLGLRAARRGLRRGLIALNW